MAWSNNTPRERIRVSAEGFPVLDAVIRSRSVEGIRFELRHASYVGNGCSARTAAYVSTANIPGRASEHREVLTRFILGHIRFHRPERPENRSSIGFPVVQILGVDVRIKALLAVRSTTQPAGLAPTIT